MVVLRRQFMLAPSADVGHFADAGRYRAAPGMLRVSPPVVHLVFGIEHHSDDLGAAEAQKNVKVVAAAGNEL